jgi:C1A family cysteine protease
MPRTRSATWRTWTRLRTLMFATPALLLGLDTLPIHAATLESQARFFRQREASAPAAIRSKLTRLRMLKAQHRWTFDPVYTTAMDRPLSQITGLKVPANLRQQMRTQNAKAVARLRSVRWRSPVNAALSNPGLRRFDWRTLSGSTGVRNQGSCGSCWDFAAHGALEGSWAIATREKLDTSEQNTLDCNGSDADCGGAHTSDAFEYLESFGTTLESTYPYRAASGACQVPPKPQPYHVLTWGYVEENDEIPSVAKLKAALCTYGPLAVCVWATDGFQSYGGGIFNERDDGHFWQRTNHCVVLIGWDDDKHAWIIKNSWGTGWGTSCGYGSEMGYMWIDYDSNNIGFAAAWIVPQVVAHTPGITETWTIPQPVVSSSRPVVYDGVNALPKIEFKSGDIIELTAGGCVQTGGSGDTWKRYVNPSGDDAGSLYFGTVGIAGVTDGQVALRNTGGTYDRAHRDVYKVRFPTPFPDGVSEDRRYLVLGYVDDDYGDNGYRDHDDGTEDQCKSVGNAVVTVRVTHAQVGSSPIDVKFVAMGGDAVFGMPKEPEKAAPDGTGRFRYYEHGSIYWHPSTGAHEVHGAIWDKWASLRWETGSLGYPTTDEKKAPDGRGRYNHFQNGSIYWTPQTGAHEVRGAIRDKWAAMGWERSSLGYPTSDELPWGTGGGRISHFQHGSIVWDSQGGARLQ